MESERRVPPAGLGVNDAAFLNAAAVPGTYRLSSPSEVIVCGFPIVRHWRQLRLPQLSSVVRRSGMSSLSEGQKVSFESKMGPKKGEAASQRRHHPPKVGRPAVNGRKHGGAPLSRGIT